MNASVEQHFAERPLVASAKQQAKRLLRLAKKTPLEVTALSQALEVVSQMHGYPSWHALSRSTGHPVSESPSVPKSSGLSSADPQDPVEKLAACARQWAQDPSASVNIITPHFQALKAMPGMEAVRFVSVADIFRFNPLVVPLGSQAMMPNHRFLFQKLMVGINPDYNYYLELESVLRAWLDQLFVSTGPAEDPIPYSAGVVPEDWVDGIPITSSTSWGEVRDALIARGEMDRASVCHRYASPMLSRLNSVSVEPIRGSPGQFQNIDVLKRAVKEVRAGLEWWWKSSSEEFVLASSGVVVFELDPTNLDALIPPAHQWMIAAYLGHVRRLPNEIKFARKELPAKVYSASVQSLAWVKSMPSAQRETILDWYESSTPTTVLDVWDEFGGPLGSERVSKFSEYLCLEQERWGERSVITATGLGDKSALAEDGVLTPSFWSRGSTY